MDTPANYIRGIFVFSVFFLSVLAFASAGPTSIDVDSCGLLDQPNMIYNIIADINSNDTTCLIISGDGIFLNGHGYKITSSVPNATAILITGNGVIVTQANISEFAQGIVAQNVNLPFIDSSYFSDIIDTSIIFEGVSRGNVQSNTFTSSPFQQRGMIAFIARGNSEGSIFKNNQVRNMDSGVLLEDVSNADVSHNSFNKTKAPIVIIGGSNMRIESNQLEKSATAINLKHNTNSRINNNAIYATSIFGIISENVSGNEYMNNAFMSSSVYFDNSDNNTFSNTSLIGNDNTLDIQSSTNTVIIDSAFGIYNLVTSSFTFIRSNFGSIQFNQDVTSAGNSFSDTFNFENNRLVFFSNDTSLDLAAQVTLYNIVQGQQNYRILNSTEACSGCTNLTQLSAASWTFIIPGFGDYSIASDAVSGGGGGGGSHRRTNSTTPTTGTNQTIIPLSNPSSFNQTTSGKTDDDSNDQLDQNVGGSITGAVIGTLKRPGFFIPLIFIVGLIAAFVAMQYRSRKNAK